MPESVKQRFKAANLESMTERELRILVVALVDGIQSLATKLDNDATVTGTDYAATFATFVTD